MSYWLSAVQPQQWVKSLAASEKIDLVLNPEPGVAINKHYTFYKPPTTRSMAVNISGHNRERRWAACCMRSSFGSNHLVSLSGRNVVCVARLCECVRAPKTFLLVLLVAFQQISGWILWFKGNLLIRQRLGISNWIVGKVIIKAIATSWFWGKLRERCVCLCLN